MRIRVLLVAALCQIAYGTRDVWESINDPYTRPPVALVFDHYKIRRAVDSLSQPPSSLGALLIHYDSQGIKGNWTEVRRGSDVTSFLTRLVSLEGEEMPGSKGVGFTAILSAIAIVPFDSSITLVTSRRSVDEFLANQVSSKLIAKRIRLYVIWTGDSVGESTQKLEEMTIQTGGSVFKPPRTPGSLPSGQFQSITLVVKRKINGKQSIPIKVDSTIRQMTITLGGGIPARIKPPDGSWLILSLPESIISTRERNPGIWILETNGDEYDVTVEALGDISFTTDSNDKANGVKLRPSSGDFRKIDEIHLLDRNGNRLASIPPENATGFAAQIQLRNDLATKLQYVELTGENRQGEPFVRLTYVPEYEHNRLPISMELSTLSNLWAEHGQEARIYIEVTNNRPYAAYLDFQARDTNNYIRDVRPQRAQLEGRSNVRVTITAFVPQSAQRDIITLRATGTNGEQVIKSCYLHIGSKPSDSSSPDISYTYKGSCRDFLSPDKCASNTWQADLVIKDTDSGLLRITSEPGYLQLNKEFIAGTLSEVRGTYQASCCNTKLEVAATNTVGETYKRTIDIEKIWLSTGEISAIVLGSILFIILIILIVICIVSLVRRRRTTNYYVNNT